MKNLTWNPKKSKVSIEESKNKTLPKSLKSRIRESQSEIMKNWKSFINSEDGNQERLVVLNELLPPLPAAIWKIICSFLNAISLCDLSECCKALRSVANDQDLWKILCFQENVNCEPATIEYLWEESKGDKGLWWKLIYVHGTLSRQSWITGNYQKKLFPLVDKADAITCLGMDNDHIVVGSRFKHLYLYDHKQLYNQGSEMNPRIKFLPEPNASILAIDILTPGGNILATGDSDGCLKIWNVFTGELLGSYSGAHEKGITNVSIISSQYIVTTGFDKSARMFWMFEPFISNSDGSLSETSFKKEGIIKRLLKNKKKKTLAKVKLTLSRDFKGHKGEIFSMKLILSKECLCTGSTDTNVKIWKVNSGDCIFTLRGHKDTVTSLAAKGDTLFSGSLDKTIIVWNARLGVRLHTYIGHTEWIKCLDISGNLLASGGWEETILLWDLEKKELAKKIKMDIGPIAELKCTKFDKVRPAVVQHDPERIIPSTCIQIVSNEPQVTIGREEATRKSFTFDSVYGPDASQQQIYNEVAAPLVKQFMNGFNSTILAYGQTFSGKTYTMGTQNDHETPEIEKGIIPRVFEDMFKQKQVDMIFKVSFLEIYQEQIRDLLGENNSGRDIAIRESRDGEIFVNGISEHIVETVEDLLKCLIVGGQQRTVGETQMHLHSSRSHAIFTITMETISKVSKIPSNDFTDVENVVLQRSKLNLVDLAGSERLKRTGAEGIRLKESVKINGGLLALGNVISVLGEDRTADSEKIGHVPYRDSKLTRILRDSLGGNSHTRMVACVSPLTADQEESINTLKYAYRARKIKNKPVLNIVDQIAMERSNMQSKIEQLEQKLKGIQENDGNPKLNPDMIDFDNEQWMQYFLEQLKAKTIRGTNAVKALKKVEDENKLLKTELEELKSMNLNFPTQVNELKATITERELELEKHQKMLEDLTSSQPQDLYEMENRIEELTKESFSQQQQLEYLKQKLHILLSFSLKIMKKEVPLSAESEEVRHILNDAFPSEMMEIEETRDVITPMFPPISAAPESTRAPSTNSVARSQRRRRKKSLDIYKDIDEPSQLKPLEIELRETRKYLTQMEDDLNRSNIILSQNEAIAEESSREIARLREQNEFYREKLASLGNEGQEIVSIRVLTDASAQTVATVDEETGNFSANEIQSDKLNEELALATKAKVDLLKELTKLNKDVEKTRHVHHDQVHKLEREIELLTRELDKSQQDVLEKDLAKDKLRDELDRKFKLQEGTIQKHKIKIKELEKMLKLYGTGGKKLQDTEHEIEKLNGNLQSLKKKLKDANEKINDLESRKQKETALLAKQLEDESKKARNLEVKVEMFRKKLDRRTEEFKKHGTRRQSKISVEEATEMSINEMEDDHDNDNIEELKRLREEKAALVLSLSNMRKKYSDAERKIDANSSLNFDWNINEDMILKEEFKNDESLSVIFNQNLETNDFKSYICTCLKTISSLRAKESFLNEENNELSRESANLKKAIEYLEKKMQKTINSYEKKLNVMEMDKNSRFLENNVNRAAADSETQTAVEPPVNDEKLIQRENNVSRAATDSETQTAVEPLLNDEKLKQLEKDLMYYKNANKELKSKLREVIAVNHRMAKSLHKSKSPIESSGEINIENQQGNDKIGDIPAAVEAP